MSRSVRWTEDAIVEAVRDWVARYGEVPARVDWDRHMCRRRGHDANLARLDAHPKRLPSPTPVLARFGSWEAALAAAGYAARFTPRRLSARDLRQTAAFYESGLSVAQVAVRLGLDAKTVRERLDRAGVARRPRARPFTMSAEQQAAIVAASLAGASVRELTSRFGLSRHAIEVVRKRHDAAGGRVVRRIRAALPNLNVALTERQRYAVELVVVQRLTHAEAARVMGIAPSTVEEHLKAVASYLERS